MDHADPPPDTPRPFAAQAAPLGLMWRCPRCARLHLAEQPAHAQPACLGCGEASLVNVTPHPRRPERLGGTAPS